MLTTTLRQVGGSVMMALPKALLDLLDLRPGAQVRLSVEKGRLVVQPPEPRYSLEALLAQTDEAELSEEERAWLDAPPVGRELI